MIYLYILGGIVIFIVVFLAYLGYFRKIQVEISEIGPMRLIYREQISSFDKLGYVYNEIEEKCKKNFQYQSTFGMYYDPPQLVKNQNQMRMVVGIILDPSDSGNNIEPFLNKYRTYRYIEVPRVKCIKSDPFPLKNNFSYAVGPKKAYPAMFNFQKQNVSDEEFYANCVTCLEIYRRDIITYYFVLDDAGTFNSKYFLTTAPTPEYKYQNKKNN